MPKTRTAYPTEFRDQIIALARAGRSVEDLANEFEPCGHTIRGWLRAADAAGAGRVNSSTTVLNDDEREELGRAQPRGPAVAALSATSSQKPRPGLRRTT